MSRPRSRLGVVDPAERITACDARIEQLEMTLNAIMQETKAGEKVEKPAKVMAPEAIEQLVQRLAKPHLPPDCPEGKKSAIISADDLAGLVERLGVNDIEVRKAKIEERWQKEVESLPLTVTQAAKGEYAVLKLSHEDEEAVGRRLSIEFVERKQEKIEVMRSALYKKTERVVLSKSQQKSSSERLCSDALSKRAEESKRLADKYMGDLVPRKKLGLEQQAAVGDRLSKKSR